MLSSFAPAISLRKQGHMQWWSRSQKDIHALANLLTKTSAFHGKCEGIFYSNIQIYLHLVPTASLNILFLPVHPKALRLSHISKHIARSVSLSHTVHNGRYLRQSQTGCFISYSKQQKEGRIFKSKIDGLSIVQCFKKTWKKTKRKEAEDHIVALLYTAHWVWNSPGQ